MDNKRSNIISLRLTKEELEKLRELAYKSRKTISAYIRALIFDAKGEQ